MFMVASCKSRQNKELANAIDLNKDCLPDAFGRKPYVVITGRLLK